MPLGIIIDVKGTPSFGERVGRSSRLNPFLTMWTHGPLAALMVLFLVLFEVRGRNGLVLWLGGSFTVAFLVWMGLVMKWSRTKFLRRAGQRRRRANQRASANPN